VREPHEVVVEVGTPEGGWWRVRGAEGYSVSIDLLTAADAVAFRFPFRPELFEAAKPDNEIRVLIDGTCYVHALIDSRAYSTAKGEQVSISGRDIMGRLVDESAPLITYDGIGIVDLVEKMLPPGPPVGGLASSVATSNARNRRLVGRGGDARAEPAIVPRMRAEQRKVNAGETQWTVLHHFLEEAGWLATASGDGTEIVILKPNMLQVPRYAFAYNGPGAASNNVEELVYTDDLTDSYSQITALGRPRDDRGRRSKHGWRSSTWKDHDSADGTGGRFRRRKQMIVHDDGAPDMEARAKREARERDADSRTMQITVVGHAFAGLAGPAYYYPDTLAVVSMARIGVRGIWYVTTVRLTGNDRDGQRTELSLVPHGTDLRMR
jgi:prophage tail gpP-like protein